VPLLSDPNSDWQHVATTHLDSPGNFGISTKDWRYIKYVNGGEELYNIKNDPYEWRNLANEDLHLSTLKRLRSRSPKEFAKLVKPSLKVLPKLKWIPLVEGQNAPASKPDGNPFEVVFTNSKDHPVELFWMDRNGGRKSYALIRSGANFTRQTRPGAVWMIAAVDDNGGEALGYFRVGDRSAQAVILD
jgi:hypothetical protein